MDIKENLTLVCDFDEKDISQKIKKTLEEYFKDSQKVNLEYKEFSDLKPAIKILRNGEDAGVKFYGNILGGEFQAFLESLKIIGNNEYHISQRVLEFIEEIDKPVDIKVFVTTSCGWCPPATIKAVSFATVGRLINASIFECYSFPEIAMKYNVSAVPKTVINDKVEFVGVKDDNEYFGYIVKALGEV
jgi:alkyl hydroperoxide reductase subunit AhpF